MPDDAAYSVRWKEKLEWYAAQGIHLWHATTFPDGKLIETKDSGGKLDALIRTSRTTGVGGIKPMWRHEALPHDLVRLRGHLPLLPKSPLGRAIDYTLGLWPRLEVFLQHGEVEAENAIRPTAIGKKNWLFVGGEDTGEQSAVIYTLIESARRHGHEPYADLKDMLELPGVKADELDALLSANWKPTGQVETPVQIVG